MEGPSGNAQKHSGPKLRLKIDMKISIHIEASLDSTRVARTFLKLRKRIPASSIPHIK